MAANTAKNKPNEIYLTRVYDAPLKMVWDAFADPAQAAQWWGPRGFTLTTRSKDLRPGGTWDYTMHGPDGKDYPNITKYLEVEPHARMVYDHGGSADKPPMFRVTAEFTDLGAGKTQLEITMALDTPEAAQKTKHYIKLAGGDSCWDRFGEYLAKQSSNKEIFIINRSFAAPVETVFEMWTDPKHFSQWLAPTGFSMEFIKPDIREGGESFYAMGAAEGKMKMYGKIQYREIRKPHRVVYTQQFSDKDGNISRHPMAPIWPETMLTTVLFTPEGPAQTRVTVQWEVYGKASAEEMGAFLKERGGMTQGWTGSFDKLDDYIASSKI